MGLIIRDFRPADPKSVALSAIEMYGHARESISLDIVDFQLKHLPAGWQTSMDPRLDLSDYLVMSHMAARWATNGLPVFKLSEDAMAAMLLTDPEDVPIEEIKAPFTTLVLQIPEGFWNIDGFPVSTIWFHHYISEENKDRSAPTYKRMEMFYVSIVTPPNLKVYERFPSLATVGDVSTWLKTRPGEIETVEQIERTDRDQQLVLAARRLWINLCLYIAERGQGTPNKKRAYTKRDKQVSSQMNVWILGQEIKLNRQLIESAKDWTDELCGNARKEWKIHKRFVVRGHWRNQACGKGRQDHKRIWIHPFWKGPEEGAKLSHLYEVQE